MEIWDITELKRDDKQDKLYNLFDSTINKPTDLTGLEQHLVTEDEEMRIDLVCYRIYGSTKEISLLLSINDITNPLNIKAGDMIRYLPSGSTDTYKSSPQDEGITTEVVAANDKGTRKDPNREEFEKNNYTLPPNLQETPRPPFELVGDRVIIG